MNESVTKPPLTTYEELKAEETRLKELLRNKRTQIQQDIKTLKAEFKPVLTIAKIIGDFTNVDHNRNRVAHVGTNLTIDMITRMIFPRGNFLLKTLLPKLVKNYTSNYVDKVVDKAAPALRRFGTRLTESAKKE